MPSYNIHVLLLVYVYYNWLYYYLLNYYCSKNIYFECIYYNWYMYAKLCIVNINNNL